MSDNLPAFPSDYFGESGMTLRDYFAAKALPFVLERWTKDAIKDKQFSLLECEGVPTDLAICVAEEVYAMADAMLKERES